MNAILDDMRKRGFASFRQSVQSLVETGKMLAVAQRHLSPKRLRHLLRKEVPAMTPEIAKLAIKVSELKIDWNNPKSVLECMELMGAISTEEHRLEAVETLKANGIN